MVFSLSESDHQICYIVSKCLLALKLCNVWSWRKHTKNAGLAIAFQEKTIRRGEGKCYSATLKSRPAPKWVVWFVSSVDGFD